MRNRSDVTNKTDAEACGLESTQCRFTPGTRPFHVDLDIAQTMLLGILRALLRCNLRGERRTLAGTLEPLAAGARPGKHVSVHIGDRDDRIVERSLNMRHAVCNMLLLFFLSDDLFRRGCHHSSTMQCALIRLLLLTRNSTGRSFSGTGIGLGSLTANREPLPMAQATVTTKVHKALDVHGNFLAQVSLDLVILVDALSDPGDFSFSELVSSSVEIDRGFRQYLLRGGPADTVNIGQRNLDPLVLW